MVATAAGVLSGGLAAAGAGGSTTPPRATAAALTVACVPAPTATGYQIAAVRADQVGAPTTAPIAVIDTGVDASRPELGGGRAVSAHDIRTDAADAADASGQGTMVAGAAAGFGVARGVSPTSPLIAIRLFTPPGEPVVADAAKAIDYAVSAGAKTISVALTASADLTSVAEDRAFESAVDRAYTAGAIVVSPVGNENSTSINLPSGLPHVLSVGGSDQLGARPGFASFGEGLDLVAPAADIVGPAPAAVCPTGYGSASDTGLAAAQVAGAAAVLDALRPGLSATQRFVMLRQSARDVGAPGRDADTGFGVLDVAAAVAARKPVDDGREVDDDVYWVTGRYARKHRVRLARKRTERIRARASAYNDPVDVYKVSLRKGEHFTAKLSGPTGSRYALSLWNKRTKGFDITNLRTGGRRIAYRDRRGRTEQLELKAATKTGIFYLAVEAPHPDKRDTLYKLTLTRGD